MIQVYSWRWVFLLNLPVVLVILLLAPRIPESRAAGDGLAQPLDRLGAALATLSFAAIVYALSFASELGWRNRLVSWPLAGGIVLLALFLRSQANRPNATMPLSLFRIPASWRLTCLLFCCMGHLAARCT